MRAYLLRQRQLVQVLIHPRDRTPNLVRILGILPAAPFFPIVRAKAHVVLDTAQLGYDVSGSHEGAAICPLL